MEKPQYTISDITIKYLPEGTYFGRCLSLESGSNGILFWVKIEHIIPFKGYNKYKKIKVKLNDLDAINSLLARNSRWFYFKLNDNGIHSVNPIVLP